MPPSDWHEEWRLGPGQPSRLEQEFQYLSSLAAEDTRSILDLGGASFPEKFSGGSVKYDMIDLNRKLATGRGGYNAHKEGLTYDGDMLPFEPLTYDIVIVGFVLHHAAQNTLGLLKQVHVIARSDVLILEDLGSPDYPEIVASPECLPSAGRRLPRRQGVAAAIRAAVVRPCESHRHPAP